MIKRVFTLTLSLFLMYNSYSCDVCGGFSSGFTMLNSFKKNSLQLGYKNARYYGTSSSLEYDTKDVFQLYNLELNYRLKSKIILNVTAPILFKKRHTNGNVKTKNGLGDIKLIGKYVFVNKTTKNKTNTYLEIGTGIKLKNGNYDNNIIDEDLPKSFNIGNGSIGIPVTSRFIVSKKGKGLMAIANYQYNRPTYTGHSFGNGANISLSTFKEIEVEKSKKTFIPQLSAVYDYLGKDSYPNNKKDNLSGGKVFYLTPGLNLKTKSLMVGSAIQLPIIQKFNNENLETKAQLNLQVSYLF